MRPPGLGLHAVSLPGGHAAAPALLRRETVPRLFRLFGADLLLRSPGRPLSGAVRGAERAGAPAGADRARPAGGGPADRDGLRPRRSGPRGLAAPDRAHAELSAIRGPPAAAGQSPPPGGLQPGPDDRPGPA